MLQKRDEGRRNTDQLIGRDIHHIDVRRQNGEKIAAFSRGYQPPDKLSILVERPVGLGDDQVLLFDGRQVSHLVEYAAPFDHAVGCFDETEFIHPGEGAEGDNQSDVRTLRGFNGADSAVVCGMDITDLETRPLSRQSPGAKSRQSPFVRNLGQRIRLIHELRKLAAAEEFIHHGRNGLCIDEIVGHHGFDVLQAHLLLDGAFHTHQTDPVLILDQFPYGTDPAIAQMVNVVHAAFRNAVFQVDQILDRCQDVFVTQYRHARRNVQPQFVIHLRAAHVGKIITVRLEKEAVEEFMRGLRRGGVTGPQAPVYFDDRILSRLDPVHQKGIPNGGILAILIDMDELERNDSSLPEQMDLFLRQLLIATNQNLAGLWIKHIGRNDPADDILIADRNPVNRGIDHLFQQRFRDFPPLFDNDLP